MNAEESSHDARYPIGRFRKPETLDGKQLELAMGELAGMPGRLRLAVAGLDDEQLATPYRAGGWTVRQVVHHVGDSHMNMFNRVRKALTEETPVIAVYDEGAYAELHDSQAAPVEWSLNLLESLHARWGMMLRSLSEAQWQRSFVHPESGPTTIAMATLLYAWQAQHHIAHITQLRTGKGW